MIELTAGNAAIRVDPADGGRLTSLRVGDAELLGAGGPGPGGLDQIMHGSFLMAPFVGRLEGARFTFAGREWTVPANLAPHALHGLVFDRPWTVDGPAAIGIELDERWPFGGAVRQEFELTRDALTVHATVTNERRAMPAIVGFHPWFARGPEFTYRFEPGLRYVCDEDGIPRHLSASTGPRPWDDSFTAVASPPVLRWPTLDLTVVSAASHWIVCETKADAVCVEPLSGPVNGLNTNHYQVVEPGAPLRFSMTLRWTARQPTDRKTT
ncbi:aldose 1-epimerase [Streptosporangium saharense]|uniref:aldose 1-epimerase n=1 Tax=Streptosporangium saharense TaxID=1706840 RepID=UPI00368A39A0